MNNVYPFRLPEKLREYARKHDAAIVAVMGDPSKSGSCRGLYPRCKVCGRAVARDGDCPACVDWYFGLRLSLLLGTVRTQLRRAGFRVRWGPRQ